MYCVRGSSDRKPLVVQIYAPFDVEAGSVGFDIGEGASGCKYEIVGLPENVTDTVYGADSIQALQLAMAIDGPLSSFRDRYEFYFASGEPYFEQ